MSSSWLFYNTITCLFRRAIKGGGGSPPLPFFENQKKCPDFGKKGPNCVYP